MSEDTLSIIIQIVESASSELEYENQEIVQMLIDFAEKGTLAGSGTARIKKMSDSIISLIRKGGE